MFVCLFILFVFICMQIPNFELFLFFPSFFMFFVHFSSFFTHFSCYVMPSLIFFLQKIFHAGIFYPKKYIFHKKITFFLSFFIFFKIWHVASCHVMSWQGKKLKFQKRLGQFFFYTSNRACMQNFMLLSKIPTDSYISPLEHRAKHHISLYTIS